MALLPSRHFCPTTSTFIDSIQNSVHKLHFLRYKSSISIKNHKCYATYEHNVNPASHPQKRSNFFQRNKNRNQGSEKPYSQSKPSTSESNNRWLEKWNDTHQQNSPKKPRAALTYKDKEELDKYSDYEEIDSRDGGKRGDGSEKTIEMIVNKLKKFGYVDDVNGKKEDVESRVIEKGSVEDIFYVEDGMLPNERGGFSPESPLGVEDVFKVDGKVRFPWEKPSQEEEEERMNSVKLKSKTFLAEKTLPKQEFRRLRMLALRTLNKTKIGGAGVNKEIVETIREKWKTSEIVKLKIEGAPALNMKRVHETLENRTGGLVIWRSGSSIALYRGLGFETRPERPRKRNYNRNGDSDISRYASSTASEQLHTSPQELGPSNDVEASQSDSLSTIDGRSTGSFPEMQYEEEVDKLLEGLGPRYTDWPGSDPLPVDADLLPGTVPGYEPPFRLLPYGVRSTLRINEATSLRRLARVLPPHFALGRSRQHQGLAVAMIKLWQRSSIVKIALKRGVQLTTSERMAEEIKKLTGGILLSRNKDFLVFYRGKNFLSPEVAEALIEKERLAKSLQDEEEQSRLRASAMVIPNVTMVDHSGNAGTLEETLNAKARWGKKLNDEDEKKMLKKAETIRHAELVRKLEKKLAFAERKVARAERTLSKVEAFLDPSDRPAEQDSLSDEERFMFRKLGLKMKAFLLLGRRGVFGGTVENMHLHWKYRELVKIIVNSKNFKEVQNIALSLEAESGGVLVSVDRISKGYAVIVFRGKDYKRPSTIRPTNLLTKRKALARSIELQRRQALLNHISTMQTRVEKLRSEIDHISIVKEGGNEELYDRLETNYPSDNEDSEDDGDDGDDGDEAFLETYNSDNDVEDENDNLIHDNDSETNFPYDQLGDTEDAGHM